jgi:hypothetical protein
MGRICRICVRERPHEQFSGRGQGASVCRKCRQRHSKAERQLILATNEVRGFLFSQSNISGINIKRLLQLESIDDPKFQTLRTVVLDIAKAKPHKHKRWSFLRKNHPELIERAADAGLIDSFQHQEFTHWDELDVINAELQIASAKHAR